jgi:hypothetical protein
MGAEDTNGAGIWQRRVFQGACWACFEKTDTEVVWHIANWFGIQSQPGTDT